MIFLFALAMGVLEESETSADGAFTTEVDLGLVLAVDTSRSVSEEEHRLQIEGYAAAFRSEAVFEAIANGRRGAIAVTVVEWAGRGFQIQRIEWTLVSDGWSASKFADRILAIPYEPQSGTFMGNAIAYCSKLLEHTTFHAQRLVIDISGDGISADRPQLAESRRAAIAGGITINGLPICGAALCPVADFYRTNVIGGSNGFVVVAAGYEKFEHAILRKLLLEIAGRRPQQQHRGMLVAWRHANPPQ